MGDIKVYMSSFRLNSLLKYRSYPHFMDREVNILGSYATRNSDYYQVLYKNRGLFNMAILDSGAFTINNPKKRAGITGLTFDGFKTYGKRTKDRFEFIMNFDEVFTPGGFEKNHENLVELEVAGINAIPVIHDYTGKEFDEIGYYLNHGYELIALGYNEHKKSKFAKAVKRITRNGCKVHVLGITSFKDLKDLPVHYCDSTNWTQAVAFGYIYFWNDKKKGCNPLEDDMKDTIRFWDKDEQIRKPGYYYDDYPFKSDLDHYLKEMFGFTWVDLYGPDKHVNREVVNIDYFVTLQEKLRQYHKRNDVFKSYNLAKNILNDLI